MDHDAVKRKLEDALGEEVRQSVPMRDYTTLRVGGVADFFYETNQIDKLIIAIDCCHKNKVPYLVIGGGSGIVFSDAGFPGLVIHNITSRISFLTEKNQVMVDSGCTFSRVVTESASRSLSGLEWWYGIPGTIGGAVYNNSSVSNHNIDEVVKNITLILPPDDEHPAQLKQVSVDWMNYHEHTSKLREWQQPKPIILTVLLQLRQQRRDEIMERMQESSKKFYPYNLTDIHHSAGSFFHIAPEEDVNIANLLKDLINKKLNIGDAIVAKDHPDFIVNLGNASASEIFQLKELITKAIKDSGRAKIVDKVEYLGIWAK
jgi:UDP-N-acetylmuramate dehydrogenase